MRPKFDYPPPFREWFARELALLLTSAVIVLAIAGLLLDLEELALLLWGL